MTNNETNKRYLKQPTQEFPRGRTEFQQQLMDAAELYRNWYHNLHMHLEADYEDTDWMDKRLRKAEAAFRALVERAVDLSTTPFIKLPQGWEDDNETK